MSDLITSPPVAATEALSQKDRRAAVEARIYQTLNDMDPSGENADRFKAMFAKMSHAEFTTWMEELRDGKRQIVLYAPNMKKNLRVQNLLKAAKRLNVKLFEKIKIWDPVGKRYFTTPNEYLILPLPVRRLKQYLDDKISVPESDKKLDLFTGQVVKPDKGSSVSMTEMQTMVSKGLLNTVTELMTIRGGNPTAYAAFTSSLEETGSSSLGEIDPAHRVRSAEVASVYLTAMHIDNTL